MRESGRFSERRLEPGASAGRIVEGFDGRERLRCDDEESRCRRQARERRLQVGRVDVGNEMQPQAGLRELAHRPHQHPGPEVRAADADVDDVGNGPAVAAF